MSIVINFYGGSGIGKSTCAAGLFYKLKMRGINTELVSEYAKELAWKNDVGTLKNQLHLLGTQMERMERLVNKADIIITDSPLLLNSIYAGDEYPQCFHQMVEWAHKRYNSLNYLITRKKDFSKSGRVHTLEQSIQKDNDIQLMLELYRQPYKIVTYDDETLEQIANEIEELFTQSLYLFDEVPVELDDAVKKDEPDNFAVSEYLPRPLQPETQYEFLDTVSLLYTKNPEIKPNEEDLKYMTIPEEARAFDDIHGKNAHVNRTNVAINWSTDTIHVYSHRLGRVVEYVPKK